MKTNLLKFAILALVPYVAGNFMLKVPKEGYSTENAAEVECVWKGETSWSGACPHSFQFEGCPSGFELVKEDTGIFRSMVKLPFYNPVWRSVGYQLAPGSISYAKLVENFYTDFGASCWTAGTKYLCCEEDKVELVKSIRF